MIQPPASVILASSSPRRMELLNSLQINFDVRVSHVEENFPPDMPPPQVVELLAHRKAFSVAEQIYLDHNGKFEQPVLVVGADTIVVIDEQILGKPAHPEEALQMLMRLSGHVHAVYSGVALIAIHASSVDLNPNLPLTLIDHRCTQVKMRPFDKEEAHRYVKTGEPLDKAGAYAIQGFGATLVENISGDYFTVVGLPLSLLAEQLRQLGYDLF